VQTLLREVTSPRAVSPGYTHGLSSINKRDSSLKAEASLKQNGLSLCTEWLHSGRWCAFVVLRVLKMLSVFTQSVSFILGSILDTLFGRWCVCAVEPIWVISGRELDLLRFGADNLESASTSGDRTRFCPRNGDLMRSSLAHISVLALF